MEPATNTPDPRRRNPKSWASIVETRLIRSLCREGDTILICDKVLVARPSATSEPRICTIVRALRHAERITFPVSCSRLANGSYMLIRAGK